MVTRNEKQQQSKDTGESTPGRPKVRQPVPAPIYPRTDHRIQRVVKNDLYK